MTAFQFLRKLYPYYLFGAAVFIVSTFIAQLTEWSFLGLDFIWYRFDLRREQNAAAWFSSISMLYCGCTFLLISWHTEVIFRKISTKLFFSAVGFFSLFLSADESAELHEAMGEKLTETVHFLQGTALGNAGYSWILIFLPFLAASAVWAYFSIKDIIQSILGGGQLSRIAKYYIGAFFFIFLVITLELAESFMFSMGNTGSLLFLLPCFEETAELLVIACFIFANFVIIQEYTGHETL